jgi:glycosyltransferase involved in cell wall biosynthesis
MKVSVVISVCDNRAEFFKRSLDTWARQTADKSEWELVIVDDADRKELKNLCKIYSANEGINIQYVQIDNSKAKIKDENGKDYPVKSFIPVLSNNVGFRMARGEVVAVTGPETLQGPNNIKIAQTFAHRKEAGYGLVYKSNLDFVHALEKDWDKLKDIDFNTLLRLKGAQHDCLTRLPHPPRYWYFACVKKEYVEAINGVDEMFVQGICAEDDDFALRLERSGIAPLFEHKIVGIHQDHSEADKKSQKHSVRSSPEGVKMIQRNRDLLRKNNQVGLVKANKNHQWGDTSVIVSHTLFGE